jgi:hypothetical protein
LRLQRFRYTFYYPNRWPAENLAIAGYDVDPDTFVTKLKFVDKRGAIMDYSKLAGDIPSEKHDITRGFTVEQLVSMIVKKEP